MMHTQVVGLSGCLRWAWPKSWEPPRCESDDTMHDTTFTLSCDCSSLATDIVPERLELAKKLGADVTINGKTENLRDRGQAGL